MTRASLAAGAFASWASLVAGATIKPTSLARSSSSDGSEASAFTLSTFRTVLPIEPPRMTNFSFVLANSMATFGAATGSFEVAITVGPFKSDFGETVLRDLHRRTRLLHLHAQLLHLGHGEAGIVSDDRNSRGLEDRVELFDRLFFCRSFHSKLFPVGGLPLEARPLGKTAGLHPSSRPKPDLETKRLKTRRARRQFSSLPSQTETGWGCRGSNQTGSAPPMAAWSEIRSSPVYAGHAIKPLKNLTFSRWRLQSRTGSRRSGKPDNPCRTPSNRRDFPFLLSNPCGCPQKEWSPIVSGFRNAK